MNNSYYAPFNHFSKRIFPSFVNVIKPKPSFTNKLIGKNSIKSIESMINGAQKFIKIYDQAVPIINQVKPMIGNIKTTFKVAKAFKRFSNEDGLEKAFDNLPDFEENETNIEDNKVANPYYPWYNQLESRLLWI